MSDAIPHGRFGKWSFARSGEKAIDLSIRFPRANENNQTVVCKLDGKPATYFPADQVEQAYSWLKAKVDELVGQGWTKADRPLGLAVRIERTQFLTQRAYDALRSGLLQRRSLAAIRLEPLPSHTEIAMVPVLF